MPVTNVIINGSFDAGSTGWYGTDLETNYTEDAYLGNGSGNHVAEMDGHKGQITVMEQEFTIDQAGEYPLSFRSAVRTDAAGHPGEGFRVEVRDINGNVLFTQDIHPGGTTWIDYTFPINFPEAGNYQLRFTELGTDDSLGAIVDDISILVCFTAGTMIATPEGLRAVETLERGDLVLNLAGEAVEIRWAGQRLVTRAEQLAADTLRPVVFEPGALGQDLPLRRLAVSPQHRMLVSGWKSELWFAESEVLVPAISLVNGRDIRQAEPVEDVTYVHFLCDGHEIVLAEGCASETFHPGEHSLKGLNQAARDEVLALFPELDTAPVVAARHVVRRRLATVLAG